MNIRNEIKAHIVQEGTTMSEVVRTLAAVHGWSASVPNLSDKLKRGTLRYNETIEWPMCSVTTISGKNGEGGMEYESQN